MIGLTGHSGLTIGAVGVALMTSVYRPPRRLAMRQERCQADCLAPTLESAFETRGSVNYHHLTQAAVPPRASRRAPRRQ